MEKITSDDTGVFVLQTQSGTEYVLDRDHVKGTSLHKNGVLLARSVMVIECSTGRRGRFGVFLNEESPDLYSILETTPVVRISVK